MAEPGIDNGMDRAHAGAGQHGNHTFNGKGHVDDNPVSLADAERAQTVREAADHAVKLAVGDHALGAVFSEPDVGNAIEAVALGMAVESS